MLLGIVLALISCGHQEARDSTHEEESGDSGNAGGDDADGDGFAIPDDCNDADAAIHPGAMEVCDPLDADEDCDGVADDADDDVNPSTATLILYYDGDGDLYGYGDSVRRCDPAKGYVDVAGDCDDTNGAVHPGAMEVCDDGIDSDCDPAEDQCAPMIELVEGDADATIQGTTPGWGFGYAIAAAGDVNGDGVADLAAGIQYFTGSAYLFHGPISDTTVDDAAATINGTNKYDGLGNVMLGVGDQDGDGLDDLMILAPTFPSLTQYGRAYLLLGPITGSGTADEMASATITGDAADGLGASAARGDLDGDSIPDVLIAAPYGNSNDGASYVFFGPVSGALGEADADALFALPPELSETMSTATGGDIDGDGVDELVVGVPYAYGPKVDRGVAGVFFGPVAGSYTLADPDVSIQTSEDGSALGRAACIRGDLDADGHDDLVVSAYEKVAVFYADAVVSGTDHDVHDGDALLEGIVSAGWFGWSLDTAGDLDDDGTDDLVVSAPFEQVFTGSVYGFDGPVMGVSTVPERANLRIVGETVGDWVGNPTMFVGDVRGNGSDDLALGAPGADVKWDEVGKGAVFVFDGGGL